MARRRQQEHQAGHCNQCMAAGSLWNGNCLLQTGQSQAHLLLQVFALDEPFQRTCTIKRKTSSCWTVQMHKPNDICCPHQHAAMLRSQSDAIKGQFHLHSGCTCLGPMASLRYAGNPSLCCTARLMPHKAHFASQSFVAPALPLPI